MHSPKTIVIYITEGGDDKRKRTARKLNVGILFIYILLKQLVNIYFFNLKINL